MAHGRDPGTCFPSPDAVSVAAYGAADDTLPVGRRIMRDPAWANHEDIAMDDRKAESLYLGRRVSESFAMAAAAAEPCAQIAHMQLAKLYGEAIDTLVARPLSATFQTLFPNVAAAERKAPAFRSGPRQAKP